MTQVNCIVAAPTPVTMIVSLYFLIFYIMIGFADLMYSYWQENGGEIDIHKLLCKKQA